MCPTSRPSATSPMPSRASSPHLEERTFCKGTLSGGGGQRSPGDREARATNQTSDKQQAAAMMEETIDNVGAVPREVSADAGATRQRHRRALCSGRGMPFVAPMSRPATAGLCQPAPRGRIPSHLSPRDRMRRKLQTRRSSAALRFADANGGAGIRPDQAGPGIPAVPAAGTGEGERRMVADLHGPQPAQTVPLWGQSSQESTWRWASPTHQELLPR